MCHSATASDATRCDVICAPKNNAVKANKDDFSAACDSLPRNPPLSVDFEINRNERNEVSIAPVTLRNGKMLL
jgi:hypothetical protein